MSGLFSLLRPGSLVLRRFPAVFSIFSACFQNVFTSVFDLSSLESASLFFASFPLYSACFQHVFSITVDMVGYLLIDGCLVRNAWLGPMGTRQAT